MSNKNKNDDISLGIIIFLMFAFPPAGIVLLVVKYGIPLLTSILSGIDNSFTRKNRYSGYGKKENDSIFAEFRDADTRPNSDDESEQLADEPGKPPYKTSSLILLIISAVLIFAGLYGTLADFISFGIPFFRTEDFTSYLACLALGGVLGVIGISLRSKFRLAKKYISVIGRRGSIMIEELARSLSQTKSKTKKELQKVIDSGIFGKYAYIDLGRDIFLRNSSFAPAQENDKPNDDSTDSEAASDEYSKTLKKIRRLNDEIKDIPVSNRIDRIEEYTRKIFEYQKKNPEREKDVHTFMTYYLPTTLKLLESYSEIERVGVAGENMKSAKENIEKTLDLLVEAYKRLLDQLYESDNMDISSDIDVLEKMMQKDGLSGNTFEIK